MPGLWDVAWRALSIDRAGLIGPDTDWTWSTLAECPRPQEAIKPAIGNTLATCAGTWIERASIQGRRA